MDYSKYLGPDWKPKYEGAGIDVYNHQAMYDTFIILMHYPDSAFIAKKVVRKFPGMGYVAEAIGCLFIDRESSSKEAKDNLIKTISER